MGRMAFRFEFDSVNKILLGRFEGKLTDESLAEFLRAIREYSTATDASTGIGDFSSVNEFAVSSEFIRHVARQEPAMPDATKRPRIIIFSAAVGFGIGRMFQIVGEPKNRLLEVVHSMDEALAALGVQSPHFEPLE
jgi:hypothetical protein